MTGYAVTDFPHPLSPTSPTTSPSPTSRSTPSTARTVPWVVANSVFSPRTARSGFMKITFLEPRVHHIAEAVTHEVDGPADEERKTREATTVHG